MLIHSFFSISLQNYIKKVEIPNIKGEKLCTLTCILFFPYLREKISL